MMKGDSLEDYPFESPVKEVQKYKVNPINSYELGDSSQSTGPDSFALVREGGFTRDFILVQYRSKKVIEIYRVDDKKLHLKLSQCLSRDAQSFCIYKKYLAYRNLKQKQF